MQLISRKEYNKLLASIDWPEYLIMRDAAWLPGTRYIDIQQERYFQMMRDICRIISPERSNKPVVVDFGCFPGGFGMVMRKYFGDAIKLSAPAWRSVMISDRQCPAIRSMIHC